MTLRPLLTLPLALVLFLALTLNAGQPQSTTTPPAPTPAPRAIGTRSQAKGIPNFGKVTPNLYRGGLPSRIGMQSLKKLGIDVIVDMRGKNEGEQQAAEKLGMQYVAIPSHCPFPHDGPFAKFLKVIQDNPGKKVFVHCRLGDDRTGIYPNTTRAGAPLKGRLFHKVLRMHIVLSWLLPLLSPPSSGGIGEGHGQLAGNFLQRRHRWPLLCYSCDRDPSATHWFGRPTTMRQGAQTRLDILRTAGARAHPRPRERDHECSAISSRTRRAAAGTHGECAEDACHGICSARGRRCS